MAEKRINPFTLEEEDVPEAQIAPSPTDQRILAAAPHTDPLPVLVARVINNTNDDIGIDVENHVGPSLQQDALPGETPLGYQPKTDNDPPRVLNEPVLVQHEDVPSANDPIIEARSDVKAEDLGPYEGQEVPENADAVATEPPVKEEQPDEKPKACSRAKKAHSHDSNS